MSLYLQCPNTVELQKKSRVGIWCFARYLWENAEKLIRRSTIFKEPQKRQFRKSLRLFYLRLFKHFWTIWLFEKILVLGYFNLCIFLILCFNFRELISIHPFVCGCLVGFIIPVAFIFIQPFIFRYTHIIIKGQRKVSHVTS